MEVGMFSITEVSGAISLIRFFLELLLSIDVAFKPLSVMIASIFVFFANCASKESDESKTIKLTNGLFFEVLNSLLMSCVTED